MKYYILPLAATMFAAGCSSPEGCPCTRPDPRCPASDPTCPEICGPCGEGDITPPAEPTEFDQALADPRWSCMKGLISPSGNVPLEEMTPATTPGSTVTVEVFSQLDTDNVVEGAIYPVLDPQPFGTSFFCPGGPCVTSITIPVQPAGMVVGIRYANSVLVRITDPATRFFFWHGPQDWAVSSAAHKAATSLWPGDDFECSPVQGEDTIFSTQGGERILLILSPPVTQ